MTMKSINRLLTVAGCNTALEAATASFNTLEYKKHKLERRLIIHYRVVAKAKEQLNALEAELAVLNAGLAAVEEGRPAREYRCKITKAQWRMQRLELLLEDYSEQALLLKELKLQQAKAALEATRLWIGQLEARRANLLLLAKKNEQTILVEPVPQYSFTPALWPVKDGRLPAKPQVLKQFLQPWTGKGLDNITNKGIYT